MAVRITRSGLGLTVGIIVLGLVVLGGLYLVKQRGEQARRADVNEVAQQTLESQSENGTTTPSIDGETEQSGTQSEETQTGENGANEQQSATSEETAVDEMATTGTTPEELPQTGPNEVSTLFVVALLAFATASYITSRKVRI